MASTDEQVQFPLTNKQAACDIDGVHTEVLVTGFADKIFIVVTQFGRIGSLVQWTPHGTRLMSAHAHYLLCYRFEPQSILHPISPRTLLQCPQLHSFYLASRLDPKAICTCYTRRLLHKQWQPWIHMRNGPSFLVSHSSPWMKWQSNVKCSTRWSTRSWHVPFGRTYTHTYTIIIKCIIWHPTIAYTINDSFLYDF